MVLLCFNIGTEWNALKGDRYVPWDTTGTKKKTAEKQSLKKTKYSCHLFNVN